MLPLTITEPIRDILHILSKANTVVLDKMPNRAFSIFLCLFKIMLKIYVSLKRSKKLVIDVQETSATVPYQGFRKLLKGN